MKISLENVCGPCQIGKQLKMSHKVVQHPSTTRVLKLLHMDLLGPIQVESFERKSLCIVLNDKEHRSNFDEIFFYFMMRAYFWDTLQTAEPTRYLREGKKCLWNQLMW